MSFFSFQFDKIRVNDIDKVISAEIPNEKEDPELYQLVTELMIHGPCGKDFMKNSCFID